MAPSQSKGLMRGGTSWSSGVGRGRDGLTRFFFAIAPVPFCLDGPLRDLPDTNGWSQRGAPTVQAPLHDSPAKSVFGNSGLVEHGSCLAIRMSRMCQLLIHNHLFFLALALLRLEGRKQDDVVIRKICKTYRVRITETDNRREPWSEHIVTEPWGIRRRREEVAWKSPDKACILKAGARLKWVVTLTEHDLAENIHDPHSCL